MQGRLDGSANAILALEAKVRDLSHAESNLPELLRRVRDAAAEDLQRYKTESEADFNTRVRARAGRI